MLKTVVLLNIFVKTIKVFFQDSLKNKQHLFETLQMSLLSFLINASLLTPNFWMVVYIQVTQIVTL